MNTESIIWAFGDGVFSSEENPTHEYSADGTYPIVASINNGCEIYDTTFDVIIQSNEIIGFNASIREACAPFQVQFFDSSSTDVSAWQWTFEGAIPENSIEQNPIISYVNSGTFDVQLSVEINGQMITKTFEDYINVLTHLLLMF
jgi:PKD repeat protein